MRNGAGTRPPSSSGGSSCGWRPPGGSSAATRSRRSRTTCGSPKGTALAQDLAGQRGWGAAIEGPGVAGEAEPAAVGPAGDRTAQGPAGARVRLAPELADFAAALGVDWGAVGDPACTRD
jgi:hypothetical protein